MIEPGDSGVEKRVLKEFLAVLPGIEPLGIFSERFTLEIRTRRGKHLLHVSRPRGVIRPVVPEDSRKKLISVPRSRFIKLVERREPAGWRDALERGVLRLE